MKTWSPSERFRTAARPLRSLPLFACLLLWMAPAAGCAAGESAPAAAAADVPFEVEASELGVTVLNDSTRALTDIRVTVIPAGPLRFTASTARLEPRARRTFGIRDFRAHDNSPLDLRVVRPRHVLVAVTDADGQPHELQVPWRR